ncbi:GMC oxidoreductase [Teichococcus wenyumeiae]|uniref:Glucose-methanol-choline oxidoreductase C-terminal domain-containing protein n=1 Tax=Teichococcus wenyumeiae TaxID=2478470 RepID=A0A3A9JI43_9PROT|nr:GMC oxidoreductase [Pseudoroseomonas wenyumeiae]RKK03346.1 hypothetical protein D6Z83_14995 [Pseudoroseomonas wenyumeiae]
MGENLHEHPSISVSAFLRPGQRQPAGAHYHLPALLRWSSGVEGEPTGNMHAAIVARSGWHAIGQRIGSLFVWVNHTRSTGSVQLGARSGDGRAGGGFPPALRPADMVRLKQGFQLAARALCHPGLAGLVSEVFPSTYAAKVRRYLHPTVRNGLLMGLVGPAMDLSGTMRRAVLRAAIESQVGAAALASDDTLLEEHLRRHVGGVWHPSGTCRTGAAQDRMAVVTPDARLRGVGGLRVCDGSIMPRIPFANTNVPSLMIAEKVADNIRQNIR